MKLAGFFLLITGCFLTLAALALFAAGAARGWFALSGFAVEALGLALATRAHMPFGKAGRG